MSDLQAVSACDPTPLSPAAVSAVAAPRAGLRPAWREPMLWLVLALPLAVLVAGALTVRAAIDSGPLDSAPGVRRTGQVQVQDPGLVSSAQPERTPR